ncbi:MAG: NAD-dependent epimerase/dehydratase family protein [Bacteroidetes bacterium]|nr:MAG: NAD-dependent epimerase/dehydratase family protein [Bacteroidota bacterium]
MKVLITGGAGFIGSHLADELLAAGHQVVVIDNYQTGRRDNNTPNAGLKVVEGTIADAALVNKAFDEFKPEKVVHAAASYKDPENWEEDAMSNVLGTINILRASKKHNVSRFVYFQTSLCYGLKPLEQPITLNHPLFSGKSPGGSSYAISKTGAEQYIELSGLNFISFRLANAYGPRNLSGPLPTFFQRLTTNKACFVMDTRRDFIYVKDLTACVMKALSGKGMRGYYHISTGSDYSIKQLFDATIKALGIKLEKDVEVRPRGVDDVFTILIDPSKTKADFDWEAKTPLEDGIKNAIEWYKKFGITQTFTHLKNLEEKH